MAKEMGLNPRSLIKNIPSKSEPWKAPVKDWVREMYRKRQEKAERTKKRRADSGDTPFLRQHEEFHFDPNGLRPGRVVVLFDRSSTRDTGGSQGQIPL